MPREAFSYRSDPTIPPFADDRPIVVFDGNCMLCSTFVQLVLRRDRQRRFRFVTAQSPLGTALYRHYGLHHTDYETNILIEDGQAWLKSDGSIRILERLGFPWSLTGGARLLPRAARDWLYDIVARNRLRWFGVRPTCYLPQPADAERFLS